MHLDPVRALLWCVGLAAPSRRRTSFRHQWGAELAYLRHRRGRRWWTDLRWALGSVRHVAVLRQQEGGLTRGFVVDVRQGVRALLRRPASTVIAVGIFAVGIGVASAVFSIVDAVLFRPFPFEEPESLVSITMENPVIGMDDVSVSWPDFEEFVDAGPLARGAIHRNLSLDLADGADPERLAVSQIGPEFFETLRARAVVGRLTGPDDQAASAGRTLVVSERLWVRRYGADPSVVGRTVRLDGVPFQIIGVVDDRHLWPVESDAWIPLGWGGSVPDWADRRSNYTWQAAARLGDGISPEAASEQLAQVARRAREELAGTPEGAWTPRVATFHRAALGDRVGFTFALLTSAVVALILISSFNVAGLLLVRASERARDLSLRAALGADRGRLFRQLMLESLLLALVGGALGVGLGHLGLQVAARSMPTAIPRLEGAGLSPTVLGFALAVSLLAAVVGGLAPGLRAARSDVAVALKEGATAASAGRRHRRGQRGLVVAELALSTVLLVGAGMFNQAFRAALDRDPGFDAENLLVFSLRLPATRYEDDAAVRSFFDRASASLAEAPGIDRVALTSTLPLGVGGSRLQRAFLLDGQPEPPDGVDAQAQWIEVGPEFFEVLQVRPLRGRTFGDGDGADAPPVVMVNETMARALAPQAGDTELLGRTLRSWYDENLPRTIVGVLPDVRMDDTELEGRPLVLVPRAQVPRRAMAFLVATDGDPLRFVDVVRERLAALDPDLAVEGLNSLRRSHQEAVASIRFVTGLFSVFGIAALGLGTIGIYGLVAFTVAQQRREIGIRMAIGASGGRVRKRILLEGLRLTGTGLVFGSVLGAAFAVALSRLLRTPTWFDPAVWTGVPLLLGVTTLLATALPALRATRVDPAEALRQD